MQAQGVWEVGLTKHGGGGLVSRIRARHGGQLKSLGLKG